LRWPYMRYLLASLRGERFSTVDEAKKKMMVGIVTLLLSLFFLFYGLNHYALWDDEALTALAARGIIKTGDTTAFLDHNIVAYRNGSLLYQGHDRSTPPLSAYMLAPILYLGGSQAWVCRLPFALLGFFTIFFMFYWLWEVKVDLCVWIMLAIAILGNVSLFLYFRQCRYYSPAIFLSVLSAYFYLNLKKRSDYQWFLFLSITLLFLASSLNYAAFMIVLFVDFFFWGRKDGWSLKKIFLPLALHGILLLFFLAIFNPLKTPNASYFLSNTIADKWRLLWLSIRDMNRGEFFPALILLGFTWSVVFRKDRWILRGGVAFLVYIVGIAFLSPQNGKTASFADIRYFAPVIPLALVLTVFILYHLLQRRRLLAVAFAFLVFWSNVFNELGLGYAGLRSTILAYVAELTCPPPEPYAPTVKWIESNVRPKESVLVLPPFKTYPLMFHAPQAIYAWQFRDPPPRDFAHVDPIHIQGRIKPDYIIAFGPIILELAKSPLAQDYHLVEVLPYYWQDLYRPELFWRTFRPVQYDKHAWQEIYILKRKPPIR